MPAAPANAPNPGSPRSTARGRGSKSNGTAPTTPVATGTAQSARVLHGAEWLADCQRDLLPYFHVVFTVPAAKDRMSEIAAVFESGGCEEPSGSIRTWPVQRDFLLTQLRQWSRQEAKKTRIAAGSFVENGADNKLARMSVVMLHV